MAVVKEINIEDLVREYPQSVRFLMEKGVKCLACGEPLWGTLESAAREKGFTPQQIDELVEALNREIAVV